MASRFILPFADVGNGIAPSDGAQLFFQVTGGGADKDTFSDQAGTNVNANPVIADADGLFQAIFIVGSYKVILEDKNDVQQWEEDPVISTLESTDLAIVYANVAAMVADTQLAVGLFVRTEGYFTAGDGGDNNYEIVASATGTDDGGSFIDLATHQAKGLFPKRKNYSTQWGTTGDGATNDFTALSNANTFANANNNRLTIPSGNYKISTNLTFTADLEIE